jgi:two-component system sensor histidine kinase YesM
VGVLQVSAELAEVFAEVFAADGNHDGAKLALCGDGRIFCDERDGLLAPAMPGRESLLALVRSRVSRGGESGQFELKESAGHYLVSYAALGQFDVYLVSLSDMSPLDAAIQKERLRVMAMVTAVFALLLLAIYALTGALLRRLDLTVARSRQVAAGDLYASFQMPGNDEISELSGHIHAMMDKIRELFALSERRNLAAREAQMRSFYSQINAHFIYNTLENIKMMAEVDGQFRVADSLSSLGRLLRYSLKWDSQYVGVSQEIAHIRNYLALVSLRFEFRISFVASVDADAERYFILKMLLQPLVENAVKHGLEPVGRDGTIELIVARADGRLRVELRDNGAGLSPENLSRLNRALSEGELGVDAAGQEDRGIGLTNIRRRLALQYAPGEYGFTASETDGGGLTLSLELPLITALDGSREDHESVSG